MPEDYILRLIDGEFALAGDHILELDGKYLLVKNPAGKPVSSFAVDGVSNIQQLLITGKARAVLKKMQASDCFLVGSTGDYGRPFRLERGGASEDVHFDVATQLINSGLIEVYKDLGQGRSMYSPVAPPIVKQTVTFDINGQDVSIDLDSPPDLVITLEYFNGQLVAKTSPKNPPHIESH